MIQCKYCKSMIDNSAKVCPHCRKTLRGASPGALILLAVIIVVAGIFILPNVINGFDDAKTEDAIQQEPAISITAKELIAAYDENEVAADGKYKNKNLEVAGTITSIGSGINDPYIVLRDGESYLSVQCYFDKNQSKLSEFKKGDQITIKGIGKGKILNVNVEKCKIIS